MRILLFTAYFPPDVGSAAHLFHDLGRTFVARGHEVEVITTFPSYHATGDLSRYRGRRIEEKVDGLTVIRSRVPEWARNTPVGRGLWQFSCANALARASLDAAPPDVALVYSPPLPLGMSALHLRARRAVPFVLNVQDLFPQSVIDVGILRNRFLIRGFRQLERHLYRNADAITVHSAGNREHVLAHGGRPASTRVLHNPVDTDGIRPGPKVNALRQEHRLDSKFVASFGGVMGVGQDLDVILEAASLLQDHSEIVFLLVGDGIEKKRLVKKSEDMALANVIWMPMLSRDRYTLVLEASDVCLTTLRASVKTPVVPSKILSAMAAGRPVVVALDLDGDAPRLIAEANAGYSLPPENASSLAETLLRLSRDRETCARLGENGRRYAEAHLSTQAIAIEYERLFSEVIQSRSRPMRTTNQAAKTTSE